MESVVTDPPEGTMAAQLEALAQALRARGWRLATAESCTGGLIAAACTTLAGSSDWFDRGFVTYSNEAKTELLGVDAELIRTHGAVSEPVAAAMVRGALARAPVQLAVGVTGIAGPGGAVPGKPVGTVWLGWGTADVVLTERLQLTGDRQAVRGAALDAALERLLAAARSGHAVPHTPSMGDRPRTPEGAG
jgi:nicotinamide-nucleotide amidase